MTSKQSQHERRNFLKLSSLALGTAAVGFSPLASFAAEQISENLPSNRELKLTNTHTKEKLQLTYHANGTYVEDSLTKLNFFLRDHRQNEATLMDPRLFDQLWQIQQQLNSNVEFDIISAYRSPLTNAMLRKKGHGVARRSYHIRGQALDIRIAGVKTSILRKQALKLEQGGVGYYPGSRFVHIDTGPVRSWRS